MDGSNSGLLWHVAPEHVPALVVPLVLPLAIWLFLKLARHVAAGSNGLTRRFMDGYDASSSTTRVAAVLMLLTATIHLALVPTHAQDDPQLAKLFAINGALFIAAAIAVFTWRWWRPFAAALLVLTILAYVSYIAKGREDADQIGLATKLIEVLALGLVLAPATTTAAAWVRTLRWTAAGAAVVLMTVLTGGAVWAAQYKQAKDASAMGAMPGMSMPRINTAAGAPAAQQDDPGGMPGGSMHHDEPGMIMQPVPDTPLTPAQVAAANQLAADTAADIAKYQDLSVAIADGYRATTNPKAATVHYLNPKYMHDGKILDPQAPEALVYANTRSGPLLLGAMYVMPKPGEYGPDPGGSITQWHMHDNVCFSAGGMVVGVLSPFGTCPAGSFNAPTAYMMHVWTAGNPNGAFGELNNAWVARLVAQ